MAGPDLVQGACEPEPAPWLANAKEMAPALGTLDSPEQHLSRLLTTRDRNDLEGTVRTRDVDDGHSAAERLDHRLGQQVKHRHEVIRNGWLKGARWCRPGTSPLLAVPILRHPASGLSVVRPLQAHPTNACRTQYGKRASATEPTPDIRSVPPHIRDR